MSPVAAATFPADAAVPVPPGSSQLESFLDQSRKLAAALDTATAHPAVAGDPLPRTRLWDLLPSLSTQPEANRPALLTWLILRASYSALRAALLYDELQLRTGLSQTFPTFGLRGEEAWRAAAQVRLLLLTDTRPLLETLTENVFWSSPDTHWLAGISSTGYHLNKEAFEALLPLLSIPAATPDAVQQFILIQAHAADYKIAVLRTKLAEAASQKSV